MSGQTSLAYPESDSEFGNLILKFDFKDGNLSSLPDFGRKWYLWPCVLLAKTSRSEFSTTFFSKYYSHSENFLSLTASPVCPYI